MTEPIPFPNSPYCQVRARVASIWADGPDDGTHPDWRPAVGEKVALTPSIGSQLLTYDVGGTYAFIVTVERVDCVVGADGFLTKSDGRPVYIAPTDDPLLSATGWTWTANIKGKSIVFAAPTGGVVDLAMFIAAPATDNTKTWVERIPELVDAAGNLVSIESVTEDAGDLVVTLTDGTVSRVPMPESVPGVGVASITDADGDGVATVTLTDGSSAPLPLPPGPPSTVAGPPGRGIESIADPDDDGTATVTFTDGSSSSLALPPGPPGGDSTVPGPPGPPGAVATAADYLIVGPGRPNAPATTGGTITGSEPVGAEYRSTDGAGVGAWVWMKRPTGWVVTDGNTGWRDITALFIGITSGGLDVLREGNWVYWRARNLVTDATAPGVYVTEPTGFAATIPGGGWQGRLFVALVQGDLAPLLSLNRFVSNTPRVGLSAGAARSGITSPVWCAQPWPTVLPGIPGIPV